MHVHTKYIVLCIVTGASNLLVRHQQSHHPQLPHSKEGHALLYLQTQRRGLGEVEPREAMTGRRKGV